MHFTPLVSTCKQEGALGNFGTQRIINQIKATFSLTVENFTARSRSNVQNSGENIHLCTETCSQHPGHSTDWLPGTLDVRAPDRSKRAAVQAGLPQPPHSSAGSPHGSLQKGSRVRVQLWTCVPQPCPLCPSGLWLYCLVALKPHPFHLQQFPLSLAASPSSFFSCTGSCKACFGLPGNCF